MSKLDELRKLIETKLDKARTHAEQTKQFANEISRTAAASPSQSGDREHSKNQAFITEDRLVNLEKILEDLEGADKNKEPDKIVPPVYVKIKIQGQEQKFYLLNTPLHLHGVKIVSINSLLGQTVLNKKIGGGFEYTTGENKIKGKVLEILT